MTTISHPGERKKISDVVISSTSEIISAIENLNLAFASEEKRTFYYPKTPKVRVEISDREELGFATINNNIHPYGKVITVISTLFVVDYDKVSPRWRATSTGGGL